MKNKFDNLEDFYLDVSRYTFDYLFDNELKSFNIQLYTKLDKRIMSSLFRNSFIPIKSKRTNYVSLKITPEGIKGTYVSESESISLDDYIRILFKYAKKEDKKIEHLTQRKLFQNIIRNGFANLGLQKSSLVYFS